MFEPVLKLDQVSNLTKFTRNQISCSLLANPIYFKRTLHIRYLIRVKSTEFNFGRGKILIGGNIVHH